MASQRKMTGNGGFRGVKKHPYPTGNIYGYNVTWSSDDRIEDFDVFIADVDACLSPWFNLTIQGREWMTYICVQGENNSDNVKTIVNDKMTKSRFKGLTVNSISPYVPMIENLGITDGKTSLVYNDNNDTVMRGGVYVTYTVGNHAEKFKCGIQSILNKFLMSQAASSFVVENSFSCGFDLLSEDQVVNNVQRMYASFQFNKEATVEVCSSVVAFAVMYSVLFCTAMQKMESSEWGSSNLEIRYCVFPLKKTPIKRVANSKVVGSVNAKHKKKQGERLLSEIVAGVQRI